MAQKDPYLQPGNVIRRLRREVNQKKLIDLKETVKDIEWKARQIASEDLLAIVDLPVEDRADHAIKAASLPKGKRAMIEHISQNLREEIGQLERERNTNES